MPSPRIRTPGFHSTHGLSPSATVPCLSPHPLPWEDEGQSPRGRAPPPPATVGGDFTFPRCTPCSSPTSTSAHQAHGWPVSQPSPRCAFRAWASRVGTRRRSPHPEAERDAQRAGQGAGPARKPHRGGPGGGRWARQARPHLGLPWRPTEEGPIRSPSGPPPRVCAPGLGAPAGQQSAPLPPCRGGFSRGQWLRRGAAWGTLHPHQAWGARSGFPRATHTTAAPGEAETGRGRAFQGEEGACAQRRWAGARREGLTGGGGRLRGAGRRRLGPSGRGAPPPSPALLSAFRLQRSARGPACRPTAPSARGGPPPPEGVLPPPPHREPPPGRSAAAGPSCGRA